VKHPVAIAALLGVCAVAEGQAYRIESAPARRVEAVLRLEVLAPRLEADQWMLFSPKPPDLPGQAVAAFEIEPRGMVVPEGSPLRQPVLLARASSAGGSNRKRLAITARYRATLMSRRLVSGGGAAIAPLPAEARRAALAPSALFDFESPDFQRWLAEQKLLRQPLEGEIDYARRVFLHVKQGYRYVYDSRMERKASFVCQSRASDCGGLCGVFVAAMRRHGIPARLLVGRWAQSAKPGERLGDIEYAQQHVKAEFYADGVGWVPVDPSSGVLHDRSPEGLAFFGKDPGDFLALHLDHDLLFDTVYFGRQTIRWFQSSAYWVTGTGTLDGALNRETWTVTPLP
jgi:transglutaminase-like putative cysteine protease